MSRPLWLVTIIKKTFSLRFALAGMTKWPVFGKVLDHFLFKNDVLIYIPNIRVIEINSTLEPADSMVLPHRVVDYFIENARYFWIMDKCICRESSSCTKYPIELGCLFLGAAASGINSKLGRPVSREEAFAHVAKCREAGLVHLIGRNKLDTVWLGVGPGQKLLTICNCCECCCLWKMLPNLRFSISGNVQKMPGVSIEVNDSCTGCGACAQNICFVDAITVENGKARRSEACRGCGRCASICPENAIEVRIDEKRSILRSIETIAKCIDIT